MGAIWKRCSWSGFSRRVRFRGYVHSQSYSAEEDASARTTRSRPNDPGQNVCCRTSIFRWYRAGRGRYTQADPTGLAAGLNLYAYALVNPNSLWLSSHSARSGRSPDSTSSSRNTTKAAKLATGVANLQPSMKSSTTVTARSAAFSNRTDRWRGVAGRIACGKHRERQGRQNAP